ncbi:MAG TPA: hypothetical protein VFA70_01850 [Dehalococcoidia bacterium]|jgi:hypothetical protein|nr:hypothetical protein [Dehalococcoidia bacterium]
MLAAGVDLPLLPDFAAGGLAALVSPFQGLDWTDAYTFAMVGVIGVLLLGAHHADEAGKRRVALGLLAASVGAFIGPLTLLGIALVVLWYGLFVGAPVAAVVLLVRRARRRG